MRLHESTLNLQPLPKEGITRMSTRITLCMVATLLSATPTLFAQGRGEAAVVVRDGAKIYVSSTGDKVELADLQRGFAVAGLTTLGLQEMYTFEQEDGRVHVLYLRMNKKGQYKSLQRSAWMDPSDIDQFTYECGCEAGAEVHKKCSPLVASGFVDRSWNACFLEGYRKKMGELKSKGDSSAPSMSSSGSGSGNEKALRNSDVLSLTKVGLDDALITSTLQQAKAVDFDLSTDGIVGLKNAGVSNAVLAAMMKRAATQSEARGASSRSSAPAEASQNQKPAQSADLPVDPERVIPFRTGESIPLGIVIDVITIDSVKVTSWPKPEAIRKAEGQPGDTTKLTLKFTYANRGKKDWKCQYRVAILNEKGEDIGLGEQEGSLDGGEKAETNSVSVKMRTLDFPSAVKLRVRALARPN